MLKAAGNVLIKSYKVVLCDGRTLEYVNARDDEKKEGK